MKKILLLTILIFAFGSCKKDDNGGGNKSVTDLLTSGIWKFSTLTNTPTTKDYFAQLASCEKDDLVIFKSGGVVTYDEGATACGTQAYNKEWLLSADEKIITIDDGAKWTACSSGSRDTDWEIVTLTENTLVVKYQEDCQGMGGYPWQITITFTH